jgi:hypothetical protein
MLLEALTQICARRVGREALRYRTIRIIFGKTLNTLRLIVCCWVLQETHVILTVPANGPIYQRFRLVGSATYLHTGGKNAHLTIRQRAKNAYVHMAKNAYGTLLAHG